MNKSTKNIKIKYRDTDAPRIKKLPGSDWQDLAVNNIKLVTEHPHCDYLLESTLQGDGWNIKVPPFGEFMMIKIDLGVAMELPVGYEAHVLPRSSVAKKYGMSLMNSVGIIDNSFCGNEDYFFANFKVNRNTFIPKGARIAQFRIVEKQPEITFQEVTRLLGPNRGGEGSTGVI